MLLAVGVGWRRPRHGCVIGVLVVTTQSIPGRTIECVIGEVVGITARTMNPFTEGVKRVDGHPATEMVGSLLQWRKDAIAHMVAEAEFVGADAVIGMKFDNRILSAANTWTEICAYGTAVRLVPVPEDAERPERPGADPYGTDPYGTAPYRMDRPRPIRRLPRPIPTVYRHGELN
jgi:uncharacterized protein YbjQ (UPF0145 family)